MSKFNSIKEFKNNEIDFKQLVDAYKNKHLSYNLIDYFNYILFFPKLLSGPIMRYDNFISEYSQRKIIWKILSKVAIWVTI